MDPRDDPELVVEKVSAYVQVSNELLMDMGVIPDTRPPLHIPWRRRLRYRLQDARERAARRAYKLVAGYGPPEDD